MSARVPRHASSEGDTERFVETLHKGIGETIQRLERSPRMFNSAQSKALMLFQARCLLDPVARQLETWEACVTAMQVGSALFASTSATGGAVECRIDHKMWSIPATGPQYYSDAGSWISAFWLAIICRDQSRMTQLCNVPLDQLCASGAAFDEYIYHWVDTLQTYWLEQPGLVEKFSAAIEASYPESATIAGQELMNKVLYQPITLFHRFVRQDRDGFNEQLVKALELHKEYWSADEDRSDDPEGWVALGPLAIACLAYDAGFPIEVESEYLPQELLRRAWLGEFPT